MGVDSRVNVSGIIRRVRRRLDVSQRELADLLCVAQSTLARWETGECDPPVSVFERVLDVGGFRLAALDGEGGEVTPMRALGARNGCGSRYPAHLDVQPEYETYPERFDRPWPVARAAQRARRDEIRAAQGRVPDDHLSDGDVARLRREEQERRRLLARSLVPPRPPPVLDEFVCECPLACDERPGCDEACPCGCEPARYY